MYARRGEETGERLEEVFSATGYLLSPLRLARPECEQLLYFRSRGLRMRIGHLLSLGGSAPVTIAGAAALNVAEGLFLNILRRALWGDRGLHVGAAVMVMDMHSLTSWYGRPEQIMVGTVVGQVARCYGARSSMQGGLTDAREPSVQAGMQKTMSAVAGVCGCGCGSMDAGLLGVDTICSPEQMVYDAELAGAVMRMLRPVEVSEEACAVDDIKEVGAGGDFLGSELTAARFREEVWEPRIWEPGARRARGRGERERVRERMREVAAEQGEERGLTEECEGDLREIISRAVAVEAARQG